MDFMERLYKSEVKGFNFVHGISRIEKFDITLKLNYEKHSIEVEGSAIGKVDAEESNELRLLMGRNVFEENYASIDVKYLTVNGHNVHWTADCDRFTLKLKEKFKRGDSYRLDFHYISIPLARKCWVNSQTDELAYNLVDGETELCYDGCWLPVADDLAHPVTTEITIIEETGKNVMFNGRLISKEKLENANIYKYKSFIPSYPTVVIGNFLTQRKTVGKTNITCYYQKGYGNTVTYILDLTEKILNIYTEWFQVNLIRDLDLIQLRRTAFHPYAPSPTVIFSLNDFPEEIDNTNILDLVNMLSHQLGLFWFGGLIDEPINEMWISEGFATYLTEVVFQKLYNKSIIKKCVEILSEIPVKEQLPLADIPISHTHQFNLVRIKGALVLECLRQEIGNEGFYDFLKALVKKYQKSHITTEKIQNLCASMFPDMNVKQFFDIHLRGTFKYYYDHKNKKVLIK